MRVSEMRGTGPRDANRRKLPIGRQAVAITPMLRPRTAVGLMPLRDGGPSAQNFTEVAVRREGSASVARRIRTLVVGRCRFAGRGR